ncbi:MAG: DUF1003 domain-containing protein [Acidobacteriia bacterium]|nr:DUF1003 domain-containing protein [Terriglobia bacterium]
MDLSTLDCQSSDVCDAIRRNIDAVAKLDEDYIRSRTVPDRIADVIANFSGSLTFVVLHLAVYGGWILINLGLFPGVPVFDKFPFLLLSVVVSLEAIFLSTFVLIKQNRMSRRAEQRAHLDLQINLLAEREMTLVLQLLQQISHRLGVPSANEELKELAAETSVEALVSEIQQRLQE